MVIDAYIYNTSGTAYALKRVNSLDIIISVTATALVMN